MSSPCGSIPGPRVAESEDEVGKNVLPTSGPHDDLPLPEKVTRALKYAFDKGCVTMGEIVEQSGLHNRDHQHRFLMPIFGLRQGFSISDDPAQQYTVTFDACMHAIEVIELEEARKMAADASAAAAESNRHAREAITLARRTLWMTAFLAIASIVVSVWQVLRVADVRFVPEQVERLAPPEGTGASRGEPGPDGAGR